MLYGQLRLQPRSHQPVARQRRRRKKVPFPWNHLPTNGFCHRPGGNRASTPKGLGSWGGTMNERKPVGQQNPMETAAARNKKLNAKPAKLGRDVQARLGQQLRAMYDEVVNQGVPERFNELINRLD